MIRRYMAAFLIIAMAGSSTEAIAQDGPTAQMPSKMALTIPEAIELARRNNITSLRARDGLEQAQATRKSARSLYLPRLTWSGTFSKANELSKFSSSAGNFVSDKSYAMSATLSQTLFDGFDIMRTPKARSLDVKSSEQFVRGNRQSIAYDAKRLCYDLLKKQKLADVQERAVKRAIKQLETSKARFDLGSASMSDFLKSKVQLGSDSLALIRSQNDIEIARATLNDFLGLSVDRNTEIDGEFGFEEYKLPGASARKAAVNVHPDVMAASYSTQAASHDVGGALSNKWPTVSAFAQYNWSAPQFPKANDDIFEFDRHTVGIQINYTIFSGYTTSARIQRARITRHTREAELVQARRTVDLALKTAVLNLNAAQKSYRLSEDQVRSSQEDLNIAQEKYNLGAATILDILTTQESMSEAETARVEAIFDYNLAVAALEKAMGKGE